jgi:hypothetical protein
MIGITYFKECSVLMTKEDSFEKAILEMLSSYLIDQEEEYE